MQTSRGPVCRMGAFMDCRVPRHTKRGPAFERVKKLAATTTVMAGLDPAIQQPTECIGFSWMARSSRAMTTEFAANAPIFSRAQARG